MRYRLQRHDGTDCSATMVPITVLRMVPIQRYRQYLMELKRCFSSLFIIFLSLLIVPYGIETIFPFFLLDSFLAF